MRDDDLYPKFDPLQTHSRTFELVMLALSIACVIVVLVILLATSMGTEFRLKA